MKIARARTICSYGDSLFYCIRNTVYTCLKQIKVLEDTSKWFEHASTIRAPEAASYFRKNRIMGVNSESERNAVRSKHVCRLLRFSGKQRSDVRPVQQPGEMLTSLGMEFSRAGKNNFPSINELGKLFGSILESWGR